MHISSDLIIGSLLSIPIGIGTGLVVDPIKRWWNNREQSNHAKRLETMRAEYMDVLYNAIHSDMMIASFALKGIYVSLYLIYLVLFRLLDPYVDVLIGSIFHRVSGPHWLLVVLSVVQVLIFVGMSVYIGLFCFRSFRLYTRVRHFEHYAKTLPPEIRRLKLEEFIEEGRWNRGLSIVTTFPGEKAAAQNTTADTPKPPSLPQP